MTVLTGKTPKVAKQKELITLINPLMPEDPIWGHIYQAPFMTSQPLFCWRWEKMSRIENDQHEICFVSVFFASLQRHFYGFYGFLNLYFFRKFHFIFENSSGMKGLNKHPKYISLSRNGLTLANMTVLTGKTPKVAKQKELITLINPLMPEDPIWGHIYQAPFMTSQPLFCWRWEKMSRIENDQHEICFVSVFFASLQRHFYGFYGFLNLYFFPKVSLHF